MSKSDRFLELVSMLGDMHCKKNAGYSGKDSVDPWRNFRFSELFGVSPLRGCLIRLSDKYIRVSNLIVDKENEQVGESIKDTLLDLASYALIAYCLYEEENNEKF